MRDAMYGSTNKFLFCVSACVSSIICRRTKRLLIECVTFSATNWTKYGTNCCNPTSDSTLLREDFLKIRISGSGLSSRIAALILSKYRMSSLERTCLTRGLKATLSFPARAPRVGFAPGPLGTNSFARASAVVGFCGIEG